MLLFIVLIYSAFGHVQSDTEVVGKLFGQGVCAIHKEDLKEVPVSEIHLYPETSFSLCWQWPPWCQTPTGRDLKEFITVQQDLQDDILSLKCCSGYYPDKSNSTCLPICSTLCLPDKCLAPSNCSECQAGYHGPACVEDAPSNTTTTTTTTSPPPTCECLEENYICNDKLECVCADGFDGPSCQHIIPAHQIIVEPKNCWFYAGKVGAFVIGLAATAVLIAFLLKKRVCWSGTSMYEPMEGSNEPVV